MTAERGYWNSLTALQKAALVLGIPAGATVLYILYRRFRESRGGGHSRPRALPTPPVRGLGRSAACPVPRPPPPLPQPRRGEPPGMFRAPSLGTGRLLEWLRPL